MQIIEPCERGMQVTWETPELFAHVTAVEKAGFRSLAEVVKATFDVVPNMGKESAENLRIG
jgi:CspA family cold shock protein